MTRLRVKNQGYYHRFAKALHAKGSNPRECRSDSASSERNRVRGASRPTRPSRIRTRTDPSDGVSAPDSVGWSRSRAVSNGGRSRPDRMKTWTHNPSTSIELSVRGERVERASDGVGIRRINHQGPIQ